ncbi:hypothetical protein [Caenimonas soli]|uniref:hypothetical protein n=1 Tax=Caenimonas soli TaxID=2735555 RepID=UPI001558272F|nr:hypothetical protein [Caenimonas soli]NPC57848.1 hypothetical protein [Caenimonas soli]
MTYQSTSMVPDRPEQLPPFLRSELLEIERGMLDAKSFLELQVLTVPPARFRPGMVVYANGVGWNPGSGEGLYRRDAANAIWVFIG